MRYNVDKKSFYDREEKIMKKSILFTLVLCMIFISVSITGCSSKSVDEKFIDALEDGLSARWELTDKSEDKDEAEEKSDYEGYIDAEYNKISKFKEENFEDKELGDLAREYIETLEQSKDTLKYFNNENKWLADWDNIRDDRVETLVKINEKEKLEFSDDSDKENFEGLISEGEVVKAVREIQDNTKFKKIKNEYGWNTYSAVVENTTNENFKYFSFSIKLIDKDGLTVESQSAYAENWNSGDKAKFEFQTDEKFKKIEIADCTYTFD